MSFGVQHDSLPQKDGRFPCAGPKGPNQIQSPLCMGFNQVIFTQVKTQFAHGQPGVHFRPAISSLHGNIDRCK